MISTIIEALCVGIMCAICYEIGLKKGHKNGQHK